MINKRLLKFIIGALIMIVLWFIWSLTQKKENTQINQTTPTPSYLTGNLNLGTNNLNTIDWQINDINLPQQIGLIKRGNKIITDEIISKIAKSFGFENEPFLNTTNLKLYKTVDSKITISFNKNLNMVNYNKDLLNFPLETVGGIVDEKELENKVNQIVKTNLGLDNVSLLFKEKVYEKISGSNYLLTTKEDSNIVEIKATYLINNYPVYNKQGFSIVVRFSKDGNLLKFQADWLGTIQTTGVVKNIKNFEEIKTIPNSEFKIISIENNNQLGSSNYLIKNTSVTSGNFGWLNLPEYDELIPSVILEGTSTLNTGTVSVILAVPVFK